MIMVKVYSKPACVQCTATTTEMDRKGISYEVIDITEDDSAFKLVTDLGYKQAPVVIAGEEHWSGFRPDKIVTLLNVH
jgi:glutaredoxin-like protein NrdH